MEQVLQLQEERFAQQALSELLVVHDALWSEEILSCRIVLDAQSRNVESSLWAVWFHLSEQFSRQTVQGTVGDFLTVSHRWGLVGLLLKEVFQPT